MTARILAAELPAATHPEHVGPLQLLELTATGRDVVICGGCGHIVAMPDDRAAQLYTYATVDPTLLRPDLGLPPGPDDIGAYVDASPAVQLLGDVEGRLTPAEHAAFVGEWTDPLYACVEDPVDPWLLAVALTCDDLAETHGLAVEERITCPTHRTWTVRCPHPAGTRRLTLAGSPS